MCIVQLNLLLLLCLLRTLGHEKQAFTKPPISWGEVLAVDRGDKSRIKKRGGGEEKEKKDTVIERDEGEDER